MKTMPTTQKLTASLTQAIRDRDPATVRKLITAGVDVNAPLSDARDRTPLQYAMDYPESEIAVDLIDAGADISKSDVNLIWAVGTQRRDIVQRMIDRGADLHETSYVGMPLDVATAGGDLKMMQLLIDAGVDVNADDDDSTALETAVESNRADAAALLLKSGAKVPDKTDNGPLLPRAVHQRNRELSKLLIQAGADLNARAKQIYKVDDKTGESDAIYAEGSTAMIIAARLGDAGMVADLIAAKADLYVRDDSGKTAADWARELGHAPVTALLDRAMKSTPRKVDPVEDLLFAAEKGDANAVTAMLKKGAPVDARDPRSGTIGLTPLMLAALHGHANIVKLLLDAGADIEAKDQTKSDSDSGFGFIVNEGGSEMARAAGFQMHRTPLGWAAEAGHVDVARLLIERGANIDVSDRTRATPLLLAAEHGSAEIVSLLLKRGADPNTRGRCKEGAMLLAARENHPAVLKELIAASAKVDLKDNDGNTPLIAAARRELPEAVSVLLDAGADVRAINRNKRTPFFAAIDTHVLIKDFVDGKDKILFKTPESRVRDTVKLLLDGGAEVSAQTDYGKALLRDAEKIAKMTGSFSEVIAMLHAASTAAPKPAAKPPAAQKKQKQQDSKAEPASTQRRRSKASAPPLLLPDFRKSATKPKYLAALSRLEEICGSERKPIKDRPGGFSFHVHSSKTIDLKSVQAELLAMGFYVFSPESRSTASLWVFPTTDRYEVMAAMQTNGANYDLMPQDVIAWMRKLAKEQPYTLSGIGWDFLRGEFTTKIKQPVELAKRMYEFCPDIVDQGVGDVKALAAELRKSHDLFFWWD